MSRKTLAATTALLSFALVTPADLAVASSGSVAAPSQSQIATQQDQVGHHPHHFEGFRLRGVITDVDAAQIAVDQFVGPTRHAQVRGWTKIFRNGNRVSISALHEGDRVLVRGFIKHHRRYATLILARG